MLQTSSHVKFCIEDEALEDFHHESGGGDHVHIASSNIFLKSISEKDGYAATAYQH